MLFLRTQCLPVGLLHSKDGRRDLPPPPPWRSPMENSSLFSSHVTSPPAFSCTLHTRGKLCARLHVWANQFDIDLGDGQFSERCDVEGSFFNSDAIPIIFGRSLTLPSSRLFSMTIGNDYFSIILLILGPIILQLFTDWLGSSERKLY